MPDFDSAFLAFPARELAGAALERAKELGAEHADFRLERIACRIAVACATPASSRAPTARTSGWPSGSCTTAPGDSPAASPAPPAAAAQLAEQAVATAKVSRVLSSAAGRAGRRTGLRRRHLDLGLRRQPVRRRRRPSGSARLAELSERLLAADGVDHVDARAEQRAGEQVLRRRRGTMTTQQRVRVAPEFTARARRPRRPARSSRCARSRRRPAAAGSTSPAPAGTSTPRSPSCPSCCASTSRRRASRPARTTW